MRPTLSGMLAAALVAAASLVAADEVDRAGALAAARVADVVIAGEVHGDPAHHALQADLAEALVPGAIVMEMLDYGQENSLAALRAQGASAARIAAALDWSASGWPAFEAHYAPILAAAPDAVVLGANVRFDASGLREDPLGPAAAGALRDDPVRFGLDRPLDPAAQAAREAEQAEAHCGALPPETLPYMVAAQRLRDAALAAAVVRARTMAEGPVLVVTGNGHARRDTGVPQALTLAVPTLEVVAIGQVYAPPPPGRFDVWRVTPDHEREDPCAAFGAG